MHNTTHVVNNTTLLEMPPDELLAYMRKHYAFRLPEQIESPDDMKAANRMLSRLTSAYSYLAQLAMLAKMHKRRLKREKASKEDVEDALSRGEILSLYADICKKSYDTISRMITVKQEINQEMKMVY